MFAQNNQLSTLQELTVDEFRNITGMSINQICNLTGADRDAVLRHRKKDDSDRSQHVQFRRHLGLLAQTLPRREYGEGQFRSIPSSSRTSGSIN